MKAPLLVSASAVALFALPVAAHAQSSDAPPPADEAARDGARPSEDIIAVSYTHLDVYKRQPQGRVT